MLCRSASGARDPSAVLGGPTVVGTVRSWTLGALCLAGRQIIVEIAQNSFDKRPLSFPSTEDPPSSSVPSTRSVAQQSRFSTLLSILPTSDC